ncbi:MAG: hypothetical protein IJK05_00030 [Bacteroidales bacterium]|nr:hypothetical protein [Bacteroidales bacterium]
MKTYLNSTISDLGLDRPFVKGQKIPVRNCWHFSTDGNAVDVMFYDEKDFIAGMNRIYVTIRSYKVVILAFSLMDTHVHFVLYGDFSECNRFMHDYVRRTSKYLALVHNDRHKFMRVPINHQAVTDDFYLKVVICYTVKNAPVGGIPFNALDYPWSSGPLYFRRPGFWSSPAWLDKVGCQGSTLGMGSHKLREILKTRDIPTESIPITGQIVFPGEYVAYDLVEKIFKTCKSFNFFMCITKEEDVDSRGGAISHLSVPMQEMRQHKNDLCLEMFGKGSIKTLNMQQRLRLARALRARYNSSVKQIARLCGLVYEETKDII